MINMSKYKKLRLLEYLIIIVIIIAILVIYLAFTKLSKEKPLLSNSNEITNYKVTRYYEFNVSVEDAAAFNIPYLDRTYPDENSYLITLTSVDNYITEYREKISIKYAWDLSAEEKNQITNYCNSYDSIENLYSIRCSFKNDLLQINNLYFVSKLLSQDLEIKGRNVHIPVTRTTKTTDYLTNLASIGIEFRQLEN
jgi:hypothetical protein